MLAHTAYGKPREGFREEVAAISRPYKLIAWLSEDGALRAKGLYDLASDPGEERNLLGTPQVAEVEAGLTRWLSEEVTRRREACRSQPASIMDPQTKGWMEAMGYLR